MSAIKDMFSFKTVYSENKTYLVFSIGKKEEINYTQVQMFETTAFKEFFVPFQCTKTAASNKISFDVSGLTSLSEYIKTNLTQEQYFRIVAGIQEIVSFCQKKYLSYDNLVCSLKYMYYHNLTERVLMAYVPVKNPHYVCDSIAECLNKLHKSAAHISITDGNYMNKYEEYLKHFENTKNKKDKNQNFSPDSLLHFFNENQMGGVKENQQYNQINSPAVPEAKKSFSIGGQLAEATKSVSNPEFQQPVFPEPTFGGENQNSAHTSHTWGPLSNNTQPETGGSATVVRSTQQSFESNSGSATVVRSRTLATLTDAAGNQFDMTCGFVTIGKLDSNNLVIKRDTVSRNHAELYFDNNLFYIKDVSANGTYLNGMENRIPKYERVRLSNGDRIYFDTYCYTFRISENAAEIPAFNPPPQTEQDNHTQLVSRHSQPINQDMQISSKPVAYVNRLEDNQSIKVYCYPFTDRILNGVVITNEFSGNRSTLMIENNNCNSLRLENEIVGIGQKREMFSGCTISVNGEKYQFIVEN